MNRVDRIVRTEPEKAFAVWLDAFADAIDHGDTGTVEALLADESYWRDYLALTWQFKTFTGVSEIAPMLATKLADMGMRNVRPAHDRTAPAFTRRFGRDILEGFFEFDTKIGVGAGAVRLIFEAGDETMPKIWQIVTTLHHIHGFEDKAGERRPSGEKYSKIVSPHNWLHDREREAGFADRDPQVLIVGGGQGGLMLAARLKQMGVDALVIERTKRVGDVWRMRYSNLTLHNELTANHFPYMEFPSTWPMWLPKDMLADWLEFYAKAMELNVWTDTELVASAFNEDTKDWSITLRLDDGTHRTMRTKHIVAALGVSGGAPKLPKMPGLDDFAGTVMHSNDFKSGLDWAGKRAVVFGTGNSGHDVAQDLYVSGVEEVSMVQRGATCVVSLEPSAAISYSVYGEGRPVEDVDLMVSAIPYPVLIETYQQITKRTNAYDKDLLEGLRRAGFKLHTGEDETGFQLLYLRGAGGYYIDVGCSELIINGQIPLLQAEQIDRFIPEGLRLIDGTIVPCDLVVMATGFTGMQDAIRQIMGEEVARRVGPVWGFNEDKNLRNMWTRTGQENFWLMGGAIIEARLFSRFLALQIKASLDGLLPDEAKNG